jgi:hypothetical protein
MKHLICFVKVKQFFPLQGKEPSKDSHIPSTKYKNSGRGCLKM